MYAFGVVSWVLNEILKTVSAFATLEQLLDVSAFVLNTFLFIVRYIEELVARLTLSVSSNLFSWSAHFLFARSRICGFHFEVTTI